MTSKLPFFTHGLGVLLAVLAIAPLQQASAACLPAAKEVAVFEFHDEANVMNNVMRRRLATEIRSAAVKLLKRDGYSILSPECIADRLKERSLPPCSLDYSCDIETANRIGANFLIVGELSLIGSRFDLLLNFHDTRQGKYLGSQSIAAHNFEALLGRIEEATTLLLQAGLDPSEKEGALTGPQISVQFRSEPAGAVVSLNRKNVCHPTPCSAKVHPGSYEVRMEKGQYHTATERKDLSRKTEVFMSLKPQFGLLSVTTTPPGLTLELDGKRAGWSPISRLEVTPTSHDIYIVEDCYQRNGTSTEVREGQHRELALKAEPIMTTLQVRVLDENDDIIGAEVKADGKELGTAPGTFQVPLCLKELRVSTEDGREERAQLRLVPNQINLSELTLPPRLISYEGRSKGPSPRIIAFLAGAGVTAVASGYAYKVHSDLRKMSPDDPDRSGALTRGNVAIGFAVAGVATMALVIASNFIGTSPENQ